MSERSPKQLAALHAASAVQSGMRLGLGSGSTVYLIVQALGERLARGELRDLQVVVASRWTEDAAKDAGLTIATLDDLPQLDLAIDGADEIDPQRNMIKGGGGALLRERIVLAAAAQRMIVVDDSKLVQTLGERWAVPVEIVQFGWRVPEAALRRQGAQPVRRMDGAQPLITDEGNFILDCAFGPIPDPAALDRRLRAIPGVMDHGLFIGMADRVIVGGADGVREL
ncbi:MAG TPA: ribose-5-phosphate isomerase RpiA [Herpetosiphonaceae bacterium]